MHTTLPLPADGQAPRSLDSLPGPRRWPLVGNALQVQPLRIHQDIEQWCRQYGTLFRIELGPTETLVVADHEVVADVLRRRPDTFRRPAVSERVAREMGGLPGVFDSEGAEWRNQRRMVMQAFAPHAIKAYFPALVTVAQRLQRRWDAAAREGRALELAPELKRYTVDIIAGLAFGTEVNTIDGGEDVIQQYLDDILPAVARRSFALLPYWRYVKLPQDRRLDRSVQGMQAAVQDLIAQARERMAADPARSAHPSNLLEAMLAAADQEGSGVDDSAVSGNVTTMLLAGEDTTAISIAWLLYLLKRHPDTLARAREEVLRVAPSPAGFTLESINGLDYLDACIQESMRLKPVAPFIPLEAVHDTVVAGVGLPAGAMVWCVLRHQSVADSHFAHAAEFDPARWLPDAQGRVAGDKKVPMPFGAGPRTCPGRYLALLEIKVAMAMILGRYRIASVATDDGSEPAELQSFVMSPVGLRMRLDLP